MPSTPVHWPDQVHEIVTGDLTAAAAYITPAGGAVVTGVAPCGIARRDDLSTFTATERWSTRSVAR